MNQKKLKEVTSTFSDVAPCIAEADLLARKVKQMRRKLSSLANHYSFLQTVVGVKSTGDSLEKAIAKLFKDAGYENAKWTGYNTKIEDVQIWLDNRLSVIEVKGVRGHAVSHEDCNQVSRYLLRQRVKYPDKTIFGLTVVNHDNQKDYDKRSPTPFDPTCVSDAVNAGYGLISTVELLKGFRKLKLQQITFEQFDEILHTKGLIKF